MRRQVERIRDAAGAERVAVAYYDYETRTGWSYRGDQWFHAASTIKVAVLLGVFGAVHEGVLSLDDRVHVRNRFLSIVDEEPFRVASDRDANAEVHTALGKMMPVRDLARHMIVTSSNLATNLLLDLIGLERVQMTLTGLDVQGIRLRRGVEDERAYDEDINNEVTANGLIRCFRRIAEEEAFSPELSREMLDILHDQEFRSGIPAGLPEEARVAHKTGEISTIAHDAGLIYLPGRRPYALAVLTEWDPERSGRKETLASISRAVYEHLVEEDDDG